MNLRGETLVAHAPAKQSVNNLGLLRLGFALMVIVSHSPELVDGDRSRELLTRTFGTMSFGEVAVDGFFLISGYLITQSRERTTSTTSFCIKRAARILPGYVVASAVSLFILAPWVGATPVAPFALIKHFFGQIIRLLPPEAPGAFSSLPYHALNGSMWTIAYEARCYAAVALLGLLPRPLSGATALLGSAVTVALLVTASGVARGWSLPPAIERDLGQIGPTIRFAGIFGTGALFFMLRHRIRWSGPMALGDAGLLAIGMSLRGVAEPAVAICGGYLTFYTAFRSPVSRLSRFVDRFDLSYGIYLYAWPIGCTLIYINRHVDPWLLCLVTTGVSLILGAASWLLVERPALRQATRAIMHMERQRTGMTIAPAATLATKQ